MCDWVVVAMAVRVEDGVPHGEKLDEEEDEDGHQCYAFGPVILCDWPSEARICKSVGSGSEKLRNRQSKHLHGP